MSEKCKIILKNYNGTGTLANLEVERGSSLYMTDKGIMNITISGETEYVYTHRSNYDFIGLTDSPESIDPTIGIGDIFEVPTYIERPLYVVEGKKINGQWKLKTIDAILNSFNYWDDLYGADFVRTIQANADFKSNGEKYNSLEFYPGTDNTGYYALYYKSSQTGSIDPEVTLACAFRTKRNSAEGRQQDETLRNIDFGEDYQILNRVFYDWFISIADDMSARWSIKILSFDGDTTVFEDTVLGPTAIYVSDNGVLDAKGNYLYQHARPKVFLGLSGSLNSSDPIYARGDRVPVERHTTLYVSEGDECSYYIVKTSTIEEIADAIRYKTGQSNPIKLKDFASEIMKITFGFATDEDIDELVESILEEE